MRYRTQMPVPMLTLGRELDRFMDETFGRLSPNGALPTSWTPAMDATEDEQGLLLELEVPGLSPEAVEVTTEQGLLTIKGEKTATRQRDGVRALVTERTHGRFVRTLQLPQGVDESKVEAEFSNGLRQRRASEQPRVEAKNEQQVEEPTKS